jgi:hypothetical protein
MKITVITLKENEDGSAMVELEADEEGKMFLLQEGLLSIIKRAIKEEK